MIEKIAFKFGSTPGQTKLELALTPVTIFVGPNNSGKSKVLMEIETFCKKGQLDPDNLIIDNITFQPQINENLRADLLSLITDEKSEYPGQIVIGRMSFNGSRERMNIDKKSFIDVVDNYTSRFSQIHYLTNYFLKYYTIRLDGNSRMSLINDQHSNDLLKASSNPLSYLFKNDEKRLEARRIIFEAFGKYFVIDPTNLGHLRIKLSDVAPQEHSEERGIDDRSVQFHKKALSINLASDGVKAFTGIIIALLATDPRVTLIDEPEAFLHPSLSNKLGKEVGILASNASRRIFVSTHSANFLMGCIQSGVSVNIVRLTYTNNVPTVRLLPKENVQQLMRNPLLRSTGILNALFYEFVIVTEGDSDRAFYQEINERLLKYSPQRGIPNCLFINAQNKQTIWQIIKPLRELGIPAAGIVDIDILKEGGTTWSNFLSGAFIPDIQKGALSSLRASIINKFENLKTQYNKDFKRDGGVQILSEHDKEACINFLDQLEDYGLFVIKNGELESWLKNLAISGQKSVWLINIFEKLGSNTEDSNYVKPSSGDVWDFINQIKQWLINANRKGIPK